MRPGVVRALTTDDATFVSAGPAVAAVAAAMQHEVDAVLAGGRAALALTD